MVKEVYISYPCITREYGGYQHVSPTPPWQGPDQHIYTYIHIYKTLKKNQVISGGSTDLLAHLE